MSIHRVALIIDDRIRPDTTGGHLRRALSERVADSIPAAGFDLDLSIDDDTEHRLPDALHPRADWAIDTHTDFPARLERSRSGDVVFAAQRDGAQRLRAAGIESATWLPPACEPALQLQHEVSQEFDVAFVGHVIPGPRAELLELIRREFPAHVIGRAYLEASCACGTRTPRGCPGHPGGPAEPDPGGPDAGGVRGNGDVLRSSGSLHRWDGVHPTRCDEGESGVQSPKLAARLPGSRGPEPGFPHRPGFWVKGLRILNVSAPLQAAGDGSD